ncbi:hypothetical protein FRC10_004322, partial [Ceratobasidium sp. 414]
HSAQVIGHPDSDSSEKQLDIDGTDGGEESGSEKSGSGSDENVGDGELDDKSDCDSDDDLGEAAPSSTAS